MSNACLLECCAIDKSYGKGNLRTQVLQNFDLSLECGSANVIVGASGSGKSTLLHLLAGLDTADSGSILYGSKDITQMNENERCQWRMHSVGFVYQFHHLLDEFSVLENVMMPLWISRNDNKASKEYALHLIEVTGLGARVAHKPTELSGGEQQRVAICRAFVSKPSLVLADEPTGNLDRNTAKAVSELFFEFNQNHETTLVVATHDLGFARRFENIYQLSESVLIRLTADHLSEE